MEHKAVENAVLNVYRKVSPSFIPMESNEACDKQKLNRVNVLRSIGLPESVFRGRKVLDVGGGTGENSVFYAQWGAEVTILEPNEISCARAKDLFKNQGLPLEVMNQSLFDSDLGFIEKFDIVLCEGVLHHTYDPLGALQQLVAPMRSGATVMVALAEQSGMFKRNLQRKLLFSLAGENEAEIVRLAKVYFQEHLDRCVHFGLRSEESVIYDTYVNPQIQASTLEDICNVLASESVEYLAAYPTLTPFYLTHPWSQTRPNGFDYNAYRPYYELLEKYWMTCGERSIRELTQGIGDGASMQSAVEQEAQELHKLESDIENGTFATEDLACIQRGYLGVGLSYFVGFKP